MVSLLMPLYHSSLIAYIQSNPLADHVALFSQYIQNPLILIISTTTITWSKVSLYYRLDYCKNVACLPAATLVF